MCHHHSLIDMTCLKRKEGRKEEEEEEVGEGWGEGKE